MSKIQLRIGLVVSFLLFMLLGVGLDANRVQANSTTVFEDVPNDYWAKEEIDFLYEKSIISGFESSSQNAKLFKPDNSVTRGQAAKMIINAIGQTELNVGKLTYPDSGVTFAGYIERAHQLGIISGFEDGTFRPNEILNRSQMSKIIVKAFPTLNQAAVANSALAFSDVSSSSEFTPYIQTLYYNGISNGSGNHFEPNSNVKRDQLAAFISRAMDDKFKVAVQPVVPPAPAPTPTPAPAPTPAPTPTPAPANGVTGEVIVDANDTLNVRSSPNGTIIGALSNGTIVTILGFDGDWAKINYNGKQAYVYKTYLKLKNTNGSVLQNRIIVIDPGHGGSDPGAIYGSVQEKNINLQVSKLVAAKLSNAGANVVMTRTGDTYPSLEDRVNISKGANAELFVSIHSNKFDKPSAMGTETLYNVYSNDNQSESIELAQEIQKQIVELVGTTNRKVKGQDLYVLRNQDITSVLVELAFISNPEDAAKLSSPQYQELFAEAIFRESKTTIANKDSSAL